MDAQHHTVERLRARLERYQQRRARRAGWTRRFVPTGLAPLDAALPHGGVPCGAVTEILADRPGTGSTTLAMRIAVQAACGTSQGMPVSGPAGQKRASHPAGHAAHPPLPVRRLPLFVIDTAGDFYPPAVEAFGFDMEQLVVVRTSHPRDAFWVMDQSLRCGGMGAVVAFLPRLDERQLRRLQLAAEAGGGVGVLLGSRRPGIKSFSAVRMAIEDAAALNASNLGMSSGFDFLPRPEPLRRRVVSVSLLSVREGMPAGPFRVDLHHATGACDLHPLPGHRPAVRTG